ncbi:MAG: AEC family transporter [Candidatus Bathyarchaeia archaeon]|nr:AEC family transporter [Candidatus Bathyarchaeota archaeon]
MEIDIILRTTIPLSLLIGLGFLSKKAGFLRHGDERVLSAYIYYFALPALFIVDLSGIRFAEDNIKFIAAGILPIIIILTVFIMLYFIIRFSRNTLYLLILSTVFGSFVFFGIPFVVFAFPAEGELLATLSSSTISMLGVTISITTLELYKMGEAPIVKGLKATLLKLSRNPLILSILTGLSLSLANVRIPDFISIPLHMLGSTTVTVAVFMLGAFLHGRKYANLFGAFKLSLTRIIILPLLATFVASILDLPKIQTAVLVIMHGVPLAVSMMVLSERYGFQEDTIASLILIESLGAGIYLNIWLLILGLI